MRWPLFFFVFFCSRYAAHVAEDELQALKQEMRALGALLDQAQDQAAAASGGGSGDEGDEAAATAARSSYSGDEGDEGDGGEEPWASPAAEATDRRVLLLEREVSDLVATLQVHCTS